MAPSALAGYSNGITITNRCSQGTGGSQAGERQGSCHTASALWPGLHEPADLRSFNLDGIDAAWVTIENEPHTVHQFDAVPPVYCFQNGR